MAPTYSAHCAVIFAIAQLSHEIPHWLYISKFIRLRAVSRRQHGSCRTTCMYYVSEFRPWLLIQNSEDWTSITWSSNLSQKSPGRDYLYSLLPFITSVRLWNSLPGHLRQSETLADLQSNKDKYIFVPGNGSSLATNVVLVVVIRFSFSFP